jgi:hypothetical protein
MALKIKARNGIAYCEKCTGAAAAHPVSFFNKEIGNIFNLQPHFNAENLLTEDISL